MRLRPFQSADLASVTALWNRFWRGAPRACPISAADFARQVLEMPTFVETTLLVAVETEEPMGFVHFGPKETSWWRLSHRRAPDRSVGMIYALCAEESAVRDALLTAAETHLREADAREVWLWPSWGQGTIPFYNGLTPSNEVSGRCMDSPERVWEEKRGYRVTVRHRLGVLTPLDADHYPPMPSSVETSSVDFPTPLLPKARRLALRFVPSREEIGRVVYVGAEERNRTLGDRECAAFDVAVTAEYRGQGWGRELMRAMTRQALSEGYTALQLHVTQGNAPAENLYFRSLGFTPVGDFATLHKRL